MASPRHRPRATLIHALAALALTVALTPAAARPQAGDGLLVDLAGLHAADVQALKHAQGASWWVEAGTSLLLVGDVEALRAAVPERRQMAETGRLHPDGLALHARGCNDRGTPPEAGLLILPGETHDLVRIPRAFSPLAFKAQPIDPSKGAPAYELVPPNSTIARMRRLDREEMGRVKAGAQDPAVLAAVVAVDQERWFQAVAELAAIDRSSFSPDLIQARRWLVERFEALGLDVSEPGFGFPFPTPAPLANVIGSWTGTTYPDEWIVVGGHYDSRREINDPANASVTPGADDNASGCAGVLEAARAVLPFRPQRSILFMCYSGEEQGLFGSVGHVNALRATGMLPRVKAMLNMDMIGWTPDDTLGVHIGVRTDMGDAAANLALAHLLADAALDYVPELSPDHVVIDSVTCCSDHMPYLHAGVPAAMSIHRGTVAYPHYHRFSDTPDHLGPHARDIGGAIVRMNVAALAQLAGVESFAVDAGISGLWFDSARDGEGFSIEVLDEVQAVVIWYTYDVDGSQMWLIGNASVDGARLRVDALARPVGARFGADFDPHDVERRVWGSLDIEFEDCTSGRFSYQGPPDYGSGSHPLVRLAQMSGVGCGSDAAMPGSAFSGLFYDPSRDGEGFSIQMVDADGDEPLPVAFWFTYTPEGNQAWLIGAGTMEEGRRFVTDTVQQPTGARFGADFDPADVQRLPWGLWSIAFNDCNTAALAYVSTRPGYDSTAQQLVRLSRPLGVDCPAP
ncbi:MAG TPA: M28 family peptidase [Xanthomonadaceae bacterium]|nr:M28 family peptidase [Xanthomonadaceae bacterium]